MKQVFYIFIEMGNAGSTTREKKLSGDAAPPSPTKDGQAFTFDKKKRRKGTLTGSHDDEGPVYTKEAPSSQQVKKLLKKNKYKKKCHCKNC